MNWYVGLSRIEKVQQQPKEAYVNVWEVNCRESVVDVARRIFQYCSVSSGKNKKIMSKKLEVMTASKADGKAISQLTL